MNCKEEAHYRLRLAEGFLIEAKQDLSLSRWRSCVDNSQLSVENSGKAIIVIFEPVEKSRNLSIQLKRLVKNKIVNKALIEDIDRALSLFEEIGSDKHFLTDYGDETTYRDPWQLFGEKDAQESLAIAEKCFSLARRVFDFYFAGRKI